MDRLYRFLLYFHRHLLHNHLHLVQNGLDITIETTIGNYNEDFIDNWYANLE